MTLISSRDEVNQKISAFFLSLSISTSTSRFATIMKVHANVGYRGMHKWMSILIHTRRGDARVHAERWSERWGEIVFTSPFTPGDNRQTRGKRAVVLSRPAACQTAPMYTAGSQLDPHSSSGDPRSSSSATAIPARENALISSSIPTTEVARLAELGWSRPIVNDVG